MIDVTIAPLAPLGVREPEPVTANGYLRKIPSRLAWGILCVAAASIDQ